MRGVENIEGPSPSLGYMFATRSIIHVVETCGGGCRLVHVQYSACTILAICQKKLFYSLYIRKFTQLLVTRTKLANWQNGGMIVAIATKSACQIVCHPRFKTGKSPQNWQNLAHVYNTDSGPFQNWQKNWQNAYVTPVTQTPEALPTRRTKWYNGWYNNHLRES
nr:MAG TPA: hypothetical protein [Siphovirus LN-2020-2]